MKLLSICGIPLGSALKDYVFLYLTQQYLDSFFFGMKLGSIFNLSFNSIQILIPPSIVLKTSIDATLFIDSKHFHVRLSEESNRQNSSQVRMKKHTNLLPVLNKLSTPTTTF
jgi:hypothetical protein